MTSIKTSLIQETADEGAPFHAQQVIQRGINVFQDLVGKVSWTEMLLLLFREKTLEAEDVHLLDTIAVALMNPGPRDNSVYAAMCGGAGKSSSAACLTAAVMAGAGRHGGAREVFECMEFWQKHGMDVEAWSRPLSARTREGIWPPMEAPAGWNTEREQVSLPLDLLLNALEQHSTSQNTPLSWFLSQYKNLSRLHQASVTLPLIAATVFHSLELTPTQGEMLYTILRLPGAAAHSAEQATLNYREFPFPTIAYPRKGE